MNRIKELYTGIILSSGIAYCSIIISEYFGIKILGFTKSPISSTVIAITFGIFISNTMQLPKKINSGLQFSSKEILRLGIILMGIKIGLSDMIGFGTPSLMIVIPCIFLTIITIRFTSQFFNLRPKIATLIAVGTSICGATAIIATAPTINAKKEEIAYAIATITVFGLIAMILYPIIANTIFPEDPISAGVFLGASIHETAQVAGAGMIYADQYSQTSVLNISTVTKLIRNISIVLVIPYFTYQYLKQKSNYESNYFYQIYITFPKFIFGFILLGILRTVGDVGIIQSDLAFGFINQDKWGDIINLFSNISKNLLLIAMSSVGLSIKIDSLKSIGIIAFLYGFFMSCFVGFISLMLIIQLL